VTLRMYDSIYVANLPAGAEYLAGYVDGNWPTFAAVKARFPKAAVLSVAVFASSDAEACDCEKGDLTAGQVPGWVKRQAARGEKRPCVYSSVANFPAVLDELRAAGIKRAQVRLWAAHYGTGPHICGPTSCKYFPGMPTFDGTQWTDQAPGAHGSRIDASLLQDDFFTGGSVSATGPEHWDAADWDMFRNYSIGTLFRVFTGNTDGLPAGSVDPVQRTHAALLEVVPSAAAVAHAVVGALPPAQAGGITAADVEKAVQAGLVSVLSKAVTGA
jgi:hypothetical protein